MATTDVGESNVISNDDESGEVSELKLKKEQGVRKTTEKIKKTKEKTKKDDDESDKELGKQKPRKRQYSATEMSFSRQTRMDEFFISHKKSRDDEREKSEEDEGVTHSSRDDPLSSSSSSSSPSSSSEATDKEGEEKQKADKEDEKEEEKGKEEEFINLEAVAGCIWSFYKLDEKRIPECSSVKTLDNFKDILDKLFSKDARIKPTPLKKKENGTFSVMHFACTSKKKGNFIASQVERQLGSKRGGEFPGDRRSGNFLIYFRIKTSNMSQKEVPEAYFACHGNAYKHVIHLTDPDLRTQAASNFMDGSRIKAITFLNIAGPNVSTKITCKHTTDILALRTMYINAYISNISGLIRKDCKLDKLVRGKERKIIQLTVGLNFVKIHERLSYKQIESIFELFSETHDEVVADFPAQIIDALDYVRRITDKDTKSELEKDFSKYAIDVLTGKRNMSDCYLGHRSTEDWTSATDIILYEKKGKKRYDNLGCWSSSPSLAQVVEKFKLLFPSPRELKEYLKDEKIILAYSHPRGKERRQSVQDYIHGYVKRPEGTYFKVEQKWFLFSSSLYEIIDRNFTFLSNLLLEQEDIMKICKYPWYSERKKILASDPKVRKILGVDETFSEEKLEKIFNVLTDEFDLFDETGSALFTKSSCLLPMSSELCTMNKSKKISNKRKRTTVRKSNSVGAKSGDSTNYDEIPGPSSSSRQSRKERHKEDGKDPVRSTLFKIYENKSTDTKELPKKISMLRKKEAHYIVTNAVVTKELFRQIEIVEPSLKKTDIFNFLKAMSSLNENEFNELFLFSNVPDGYFVLPGDRIEPNKVELFDLLIHDGRNRQKRITYLFQNKKGLDYHTRDACAQIRNSAELLWHDFMRGHKQHIKLFWEMVVESTTAPSAYRHFVKKRLLKLNKQEFLGMFDDDVQLVFVLAFAPTNAKHNQFLKWNFKPITNEMLCEQHFDSDIHAALQEKDILNELGYLTDSFIDMTQIKFGGECVKNSHLKKLSIEKRNALYKFLKNNGTCDMSTIAKLELLTLDNCFNTFQIGGGGRRFKLQICHIKSF